MVQVDELKSIYEVQNNDLIKHLKYTRKVIVWYSSNIATHLI